MRHETIEDLEKCVFALNRLLEGGSDLGEDENDELGVKLTRLWIHSPDLWEHRYSCYLETETPEQFAVLIREWSQEIRENRFHLP